LVNLLVKDDDVRVKVHFLHPDILDLVAVMPCFDAAVVRRVLLRRLRPLLHCVDLLTELQRMYEAQLRRDAAHAGVARTTRALFDPLVMHDACTLFAGLVGAAWGGRGQGSWFALPEPCSCGANEWGLSSTPPEIVRSRGLPRLTRHSLDHLACFCWTCTRQRPADLAAVLVSWAGAGQESPTTA
jgi:hypothetical protein